MSDNHERNVVSHYQASGLAERILSALAAAGLDTERLAPEDLAPVDEFHIGGRAVTKYAVARMRLTGSERVLDIGCGLGGAARYVAAATGCHVTGIDLTPAYIETARVLSARTGLSERTTFLTASALRMPFADAAFDAAMTLHVAMNIKDRAGLYREAARVLRDSAVFCIYDVMKGRAEGLKYPVPWAETAANSHLVAPQDMLALLAEVGFTVEQVEDRTEFGIAFFRERLSAGGPPSPLGLHILMGANSRAKFENMLHNLDQGFIAPVLMLARRAF
jgi:MPBQ/MSBQ methyltransferase